MWFSKKLSKLTSVEHSKEWYSRIKGQLDEARIDNVDYRYIPLAHLEDEKGKDGYYRCPSYVDVVNEFSDCSIDILIVDGQYRNACIKYSIPKIKHGGLLLIDDVHTWSSLDELPVPKDWELLDLSSDGIRKCGIWQKS